MTDSSKQLPVDSTVSSVRSNISDASSGYALVSVREKHRCDVRDVYPLEPPPDYERSSPVHQEPNARTTLLVKSSTSQSLQENKLPLLSTPENQPEKVQVTGIKISLADLNIEINTQSPRSANTDTEFFPQNRRNKSPCCVCNCSKSTKVKILFVLLLIMALALILVIVNFTVCIASVTTACK